MKSVGEIIKDTRNKKKFSKKKLANLTKIKKEFIEAIETSRWEQLPEYPVVYGFVRSIASVLEIDQKNLLAILRRDYPPQSLPINPKPDIEQKFVWSPKLAFIIGTSLVSIVIIGYLIFQYLNFISPPSLMVDYPKEGQTVKGRNLLVEGSTDSNATVLVNNQPTIVEDDGKFRAEIEIYEGTNQVVIVSRSRSGKETVVSRNIKPEL
jgi:cytoskeletal protein RodZ